MRNCWIFFRDKFGSWQWEWHGDTWQSTKCSIGSFPDAKECRDDAILAGYEPSLHRAIFPREFAPTATETQRSIPATVTIPWDEAYPISRRSLIRLWLMHHQSVVALESAISSDDDVGQARAIRRMNRYEAYIVRLELRQAAA